MKYALLDTDFLYKSHVARNSKSDVLIDLVINFKDFSFFCHEQIVKELTKHSINPDPNPWLEEKIKVGKIKLYTDLDIIKELNKIYGKSTIAMYITLLKTSCDTFNSGFFDIYYKDLNNISSDISVGDFITILQNCDSAIPSGNGLGEKKSFVLIQLFQILYDKQVCIFFSEDSNARKSIAALSNPTDCISILGVFYLLKNSGYDKAYMKEYYTNLSGFLKNQKDYKVYTSDGLNCMRVPINQLFDELYDDKFILLRNGYLKYK